MTLEEIIRVTNKQFLEEVLYEFGKESHAGHLAKRATLDPYVIGQMRVKEMGIPEGELDYGRIELIGRCSIDRIWCLVAKLNGKWKVGRVTKENIKRCQGCGFFIKGKKVFVLLEDARAKRRANRLPKNTMEHEDNSYTKIRETRSDVWKCGTSVIRKNKKSSGGSIMPNSRIYVGTNSIRERLREREMFPEKGIHIAITK